MFDSSKQNKTPQKLLDIKKLKALIWKPVISLNEEIIKTISFFLEDNGIRSGKLKSILLPSFLILIFLTVLCSLKYPGRIFIYIAFTLIINSWLFQVLLKSRYFFDKYIVVFLWLGLWLKLTYRLGILDGKYVAPIGEFNSSGNDYDQTLIACCIGALGFWVASLILNKVRIKESTELDTEVLSLYKNKRHLILISFLLIIFLTAYTNLHFGFYQKGMVPKFLLPFGLNGIFTWLLSFGLASITCILLDLEIRTKRNPFTLTIIGIIEILVSNVSLLSRGFILNGSALVYGSKSHFYKFKIFSTRKNQALMVAFFFSFFVTSVLCVNYLRQSAFSEVNSISQKKLTNSELQKKLIIVKNDTLSLFIDRWVGLEGIMSVSSSKLKGWNLLREAWQENFRSSGTSFYDHKLIESQYLHVDSSKHHFINLPGIIAFLFYSGSYAFLFLGTFLLWILCWIIEIFAFKASAGNLIFCSIIGITLAYRLSHFGYAPSRSYVLIGTIIANILFVFIALNFLKWVKTLGFKISRKEIT